MKSNHFLSKKDWFDHFCDGKFPKKVYSDHFLRIGFKINPKSFESFQKVSKNINPVRDLTRSNRDPRTIEKDIGLLAKKLEKRGPKNML